MSGYKITTLSDGNKQGSNVRQIPGWNKPRPKQPGPSVTPADMQRDILAANAKLRATDDLINELTFWVQSENGFAFEYFNKALQNFEPYGKAERFRAEQDEQKRLLIENNRRKLAGRK